MATVKSILDHKGKNVEIVLESQTALEAAKLMNAKRIGCVVVVRGPRVMGIFTERDILTRIVAAGRDPAITPVAEVMTTPVACCHMDTTLDELVAVVTSKRIRHMPVIDGAQLVGIVTSGDVLATQVKEHQDSIEYLNNYMHGCPQA